MQTALALNPPPPAGEGFKAVTRDAFFAVIKPLDVHPSPQGKYPYTCLWKSRAGYVRGKTVDYYTQGENGLTSTLYCLPK